MSEVTENKNSDQQLYVGWTPSNRDEGLLLKLLHQGGLVVSSAQRRLVHWESALAQPIIGYSHPLVGRHLQAQLGRRLAGKNEATLAAAMLNHMTTTERLENSGLPRVAFPASLREQAVFSSTVQHSTARALYQQQHSGQSRHAKGYV
ncbi:hypothetical protein C0Q70_21193 [Pomacea canaliculata]|uniref:Uncharacterized protein n=1 Tax=Pomacea canaliculata TaxID=400727 RepID=A0A2T7NBU6_POMCA|nr:hypothetical protein C0Q70_21193 [Pomacea canaliculata]